MLPCTSTQGNALNLRVTIAPTYTFRLIPGDIYSLGLCTKKLRPFWSDHTLSFSFGSGKQYHYSQIPSKESMDSLIRAYLKDNKVQQFTSIIYNSGIKYSSYKELYLQFSYF